MVTIKDDIDFDKIRKAFTGLPLHAGTQRAMVIYAEKQLGWSHSKAMKAAEYIGNESRAAANMHKLIEATRPKKLDELIKEIEL